MSRRAVPNHAAEIDPASDESREPIYRRLPDWLVVLGRGAWLSVGIVLAIGITLGFAGLISSLLIPLIFAAILAAICVPLVDRMSRRGFNRGIASTLVVIAGLMLLIAIGYVVVVGVVGAASEIVSRFDSSMGEVGRLTDASPETMQQIAQKLKDITGTLISGFLSGLSSATALVVGLVTGTFIMLYLMKDWDLVLGWVSRQFAKPLGLSPEQGLRILNDTATSFRLYALGLTIVGVMNGLVVGGGAALLGVPSPVTIGLVTFVTSYIPFFGAFFAGMFAVAIALGANGLTTALIMLALTLLANNTLQNLIEPVAFSKTLELHPLVVLLVTTGAGLLFGILGATLAAPITAVVLQTLERFRSDDAEVKPAPV